MELIWSTLIGATAYLLKSEVLEPLKVFRDILGRIDNKLKYHANVITNSGLKPELVKEASTSLRELSCELEARYKQLPMVGILSMITFLKVPSPTTAAQAASKLIYLSNAIGEPRSEIRNADVIDEVREMLKIPELGKIAGK